jgi:transporter family protein
MFATQSLAYSQLRSRLLHERSKTNQDLRPAGYRRVNPRNERVLLEMSLSGQHAVTTLSKFSSRLFLSKKLSATTALRGGGVVLAASTNAVAISSWIFPALACAASYALYNIFIKKASATIDPILGGVLLQFVAALVGTMLLVVQRVRATNSTNTLLLSKSGLSWAVAAGVAVGAAEILSFTISGKGVPATQSIPIVVGGSILIGTILGSVWLQERLTRSGWFGVILIAVGIALVGMDPGSMAGH